MEAHFHLSNEQQSAHSETHCSVDSEGKPPTGCNWRWAGKLPARCDTTCSIYSKLLNATFRTRGNLDYYSVDSDEIEYEIMDNSRSTSDDSSIRFSESRTVNDEPRLWSGFLNDWAHHARSILRNASTFTLNLNLHINTVQYRDSSKWWNSLSEQRS